MNYSYNAQSTEGSMYTENSFLLFSNQPRGSCDIATSGSEKTAIGSPLTRVSNNLNSNIPW